MYQRILMPTDGSDLAAVARPHVAMVAGLSDAEVVVLAVVRTQAQALAQFAPSASPFDVGAGIGVAGAQELMEAQREEAAQHLDAAEQALRAANVAQVRCEIAEGNAGAAILDTAERLECDLIVMATHGRTGLRRAILGSVADHVVRHARHVPVLLIRPEGSVTAGG